jgi:ribosomal protein S18 acetylase RimI-like enzyme
MVLGSVRRMKIRNANIEDLQEIKKMDEISLKAIHSLNYFKKNLKNILVAVEGQKVVGYLMLKDNVLMNLVVHPKYREKGIGKILVEEVTKKSKKLITRTREGNADALGFFKHFGFKYKRKIDKYYKNGDNAIEMEWEKT